MWWASRIPFRVSVQKCSEIVAKKIVADNNLFITSLKKMLTYTPFLFWHKDEDQHIYYVVTEYCQGGSLAEKIKLKRGPEQEFEVLLKKICQIFRHICTYITCVMMTFLGTELDCWNLYGSEIPTWKRVASQKSDAAGTAHIFSVKRVFTLYTLSSIGEAPCRTEEALQGYQVFIWSC